MNVMAEAIIEVNNANIYQGDNLVLQDVNLRVNKGEFVYLVGKTGTGKSEFLKQMIMQDINNGEGLAVVDPHGDLIEDALAHVPKERAKDVIVFDPSDIERPLGLNLLGDAFVRRTRQRY